MTAGVTQIYRDTYTSIRPRTDRGIPRLNAGYLLLAGRWVGPTLRYGYQKVCVSYRLCTVCVRVCVRRIDP